MLMVVAVVLAKESTSGSPKTFFQSPFMASTLAS
jgi:hypothetical protein